MRRLALLAVLVLATSCDSAVEPTLAIRPGHVSVELLTDTVVAGTPAQVRFRNHAGYQMWGGGFSPRIDIWPDHRQWAIRNGQLFKSGGVALGPGETVDETLDVVETLPPGEHVLRIGFWTDAYGPSYSGAGVAELPVRVTVR